MSRPVVVETGRVRALACLSWVVRTVTLVQKASRRPIGKAGWRTVSVSSFLAMIMILDVSEILATSAGAGV